MKIKKMKNKTLRRKIRREIKLGGELQKKGNVEYLIYMNKR